LLIRQDDIKIRKKPAPPGKAHESSKAYTRKNKHPKRDSDPGAGPSKDGPFSFEMTDCGGRRVSRK
jgi:hypothetical protein